MSLETIERALAELASDPANPAALERMRDALHDPTPRAWPRPWLANRWTEATLPGVSALHDRVALTLVPRLEAGSAAECLAALQVLAYAPSTEAVPALSNVIGRADASGEAAEVAAATAQEVLALDVLAETGARAAASAIAPRVGANDPRVRRSACAALGRLRAVEHAPALLHALEGDPDANVRRWAAHALGEVAAQSDPGTRQVVIRRLAGLARDSALPELMWIGVREGFAALGGEAVEPLLEQSHEPNPTLQRRALEALAPFDDARVTPRLRELQLAPEVALRFAALYALAQRQDTFAVSRLMLESRSKVDLEALSATLCLAYLGKAGR